MRVLIANDFVIAEWNGEHHLTDLKALKESERLFLVSLTCGNYARGESKIDLRFSPYKLSSTPYKLYGELNWIYTHAKQYAVELDESFMTVYNALLESYKTALETCKKVAMQRITERFEKAYEKKKQGISNSCDTCLSCSDVIDGDLYCEKYRKHLEVTVGDKYDIVHRKHLMYASHGVKLPACVEQKKKDLDEEKEQRIQESVNEYLLFDAGYEIACEMNKGGVIYE
jgi:hypothetical protein